MGRERALLAMHLPGRCDRVHRPSESRPVRAWHARGSSSGGQEVNAVKDSGTQAGGLWFDVRGALRQLDPKEAEILRLRFGIGDRMHDRNEVGARFGVGRWLVRRMETRALRKLRAAALEEFLRAGRGNGTAADDRP